MFTYNFLEELEKAGSRIKDAKKIKRPGATAADVHRALTELMKNPNVPGEVKKQLVQAHKHTKREADKEVLEAQTKRPGYKPLEVGEAGKEKAGKEAATQAKVDEWMESNTPKQVKELGHAAQYEQDVNNPKMRSKSAEKLTGGVKQRLATGEGIAIRDKAYGQNLDFQRQLKEKEAKVRAAKGPSEVINIKAASQGGPQIPEQHAKDPQIVELMKLRGNLTPEHHPAIDEHIGNRVQELSAGSMKKSISESLAFSASGQWLIKSR